jgi:hypothetical protein
MIYFGFSISWPLKQIEQKDYIEKTWKLSKNKSLEVQLSRAGNTLLGASVDFSPYGCDHAGLRIVLDFMRYFLVINLYDNRHWDYENNCWEKYE